MSEQAPFQINKRIFLVRRHRVMFDSDLAKLYGVETKSLNRAVRRSQIRFPEDFMFQLTEKETELLRYQFGTSKNEAKSEKRGGLGDVVALEIIKISVK